MQSNGAEGVPSTQRDENVSVLENFHSTIYFLVTRLRVVYTTIPTFSSMDATTRARWLTSYDDFLDEYATSFSITSHAAKFRPVFPPIYFLPFFFLFSFFLLNVICNYSRIQIWVEKRVHYEIFALFFLHQGMLKLLLQIEIRDKIKKLRGT